MMVLGIVGSPRRGGNTEVLMEEALAAARKAGAETEIVLVADKKISGCDGCASCFKTGVCRIKDDMQAIYQQMEIADAIILGSPVYFGSVTAQMKAVIDRTYLFIGDSRLKGKVAALVLALGKVGAGQTQSQVYLYFVNQGMISVRGAVGYGREKGAVRTGDGARIDMKALEEARSLGTEVVDMLRKLGVK